MTDANETNHRHALTRLAMRRALEACACGHGHLVHDGVHGDGECMMCSRMNAKCSRFEARRP